MEVGTLPGVLNKTRYNIIFTIVGSLIEWLSISPLVESKVKGVKEAIQNGRKHAGFVRFITNFLIISLTNFASS